ncbi:MAG: thermonuclease family protein [Methylovulum sp.]|nr:thermonuclease family protein [Methylovulum sp.]
MMFLLILLLSLPASTNAGIYQWQDSNGSRHYSDRASAGAIPIDIKPGYGYSRVKTVYDGDTLVLEDGRKIRLLGINTPEVAHRNQPADAGGEEAKQWLIDKLKNTAVRLETSAEKTDKYGRTLAHVFTENKDHINLQLVEAGLASVNLYPPNLLYAKALVAAEEQAQQAGRGLWQRPEYAPIPVAAFSAANYPGYQWRRLTGNVTGLRDTRKFVYLEFSRQFDVRIERQWLPLFTDLNGYVGKMLEVRGWLNRSKGHTSMLIRHPSAIKIVSEKNAP